MNELESGLFELEIRGLSLDWRLVGPGRTQVLRGSLIGTNGWKKDAYDEAVLKKRGVGEKQSLSEALSDSDFQKHGPLRMQSRRTLHIFPWISCTL
jgi:hypothetical protein